MGLLEQGAEWLRSQRDENLSTAVTYRRREGTSKTVLATIGRTLFRAEDQYGVTIRVASKDFIVSRAALGFVPEKGDVIYHNRIAYEVLAPNGEPVWRTADAGSIRIHTKEVGNE